MNKLETLQRLQEIRLQLIQIKKERDFLTTIENALKTNAIPPLPIFWRILYFPQRVMPGCRVLCIKNHSP